MSEYIQSPIQIVELGDVIDFGNVNINPRDITKIAKKTILTNGVTPMFGFKAFNADLTCLNFQYEIGKTYEFDGPPIVCKQGFHFCKSLADTYRFYDMSDWTRICKVEALGEIKTENDIKFCTNKIRIIEEITDKSIKHCNLDGSVEGFCNTGRSNSGNFNTGNKNEGDRNTGDKNVGFKNIGDYNFGKMNFGDCNQGDYNVGNYNIGAFNVGNNNPGTANTGDFNQGGYNTGDCNYGKWNSGCHNRGNRNSGDWNATSFSSGCFNTEESTIMMFNKQSNWTYSDWLESEARIVLRNYRGDYTIKYVRYIDMTEEEKKNNPGCKTTGGFLRIVQQNPQEWWNALSNEEKNCVLELPNFDAKIFEECTGIKV